MTSQGNEARRPGLLVLASTYPRWQGDTEPGFVHELTRRLVADFDVVVLTPSSPGVALHDVIDGVEIVRYRYAPRALETLVYGGGMPHHLRRSPWKALLLPSFLLGQLWAAAKVLRTRHVAAIHAHWLLPQGVVAALLTILVGKCPPVMVTAHGSDVHGSKSRLARVLRRFTLRRASTITVVGRGLMEQLIAEGVDGGRIAVQPMGIDLDGFRPGEFAARDPGGILFVGRLVEGKGAAHLVAAMPAILDRCPSARLKIVGSGPEAPALQRLALATGVAGSVEFLGAVPHDRLPALYRAARAVGAPFDTGTAEGFGLVVVEALACGCKVVAGDIPGIEDIVCSPVLGTIVARGDSAALADAVCDALEAPGSAADEWERARAMRRFGWQAAATDYRDALASMVEVA